MVELDKTKTYFLQVGDGKSPGFNLIDGECTVTFKGKVKVIDRPFKSPEDVDDWKIGMNEIKHKIQQFMAAMTELDLDFK